MGARASQIALPVFDVRKLGATGNGSADDTAAIVAAIASMPDASNLTGSGTLFFPAGTYVTTGFTLPKEKRITLMGAGGGSSSLYLKTGSNASVVTTEGRSSSTNGWWHEICHLGIDGNKSNQSSGHGLEVKSTRTFVHHCYIANAKENGIHNFGTASFTAHNNFFTDLYIHRSGGNGLYFNQYAQDPFVSNVWSVESGGDGLKSEATVVFAQNLHVADSLGHGVNLVGTSGGYGMWSNVYAHNNAAKGFNITGSGETGHAISNCQVTANLTGGIYVANTNGHVSISNCMIVNNVGYGVEFNNCNHNSVTGCQFYDTQTPKTQTYGVKTTGTSDYNLIAMNVMRNNQHLTGAYSLAGTNDEVAHNIDLG